MASPSPWPGTFVRADARLRKRGSKIRCRSSGGTPGPASCTQSSNRWPTPTRAQTQMGLVGGEYLAAFWSRLASTRSIPSGSTQTGGRAAGTSTLTRRPRSRPRTRWSPPSTSAVGLVSTRSATADRAPVAPPARVSASTSSASRSVSTSISARKSRRVAASQCTSVLRRLLTKPLMWLNGRRSSWASTAGSSADKPLLARVAVGRTAADRRGLGARPPRVTAFPTCSAAPLGDDRERGRSPTPGPLLAWRSYAQHRARARRSMSGLASATLSSGESSCQHPTAGAAAGHHPKVDLAGGIFTRWRPDADARGATARATTPGQGR